jgi:hypothetical protein
MPSKEQILSKFRPLAVLRAETESAYRALPAALAVDRMVAIRRFPFRIGRESRFRVVDGQPQRIERQLRGTHEPTNDLYLLDPEEPLHVSREHLLIERTGGGYVLQDRRSVCGVAVGATHIGGRELGGNHELRDGDVISVGTPATPYRFTFIALE